MGRTAFRWAAGGCAALVIFAALPGTGAMIGFFAAIAVAFFLAPIAIAIAALLGRAGLTVELEPVLWALAAGYGLLIAAGLVSALRHSRRGDLSMARDRAARTLLAISLALACALGAVQLQHAWPA